MGCIDKFVEIRDDKIPRFLMFGPTVIEQDMTNLPGVQVDQLVGTGMVKSLRLYLFTGQDDSPIKECTDPVE